MQQAGNALVGSDFEAGDMALKIARRAHMIVMRVGEKKIMKEVRIAECISDRSKITGAQETHTRINQKVT
jgi:hypothetical protein